MKLGLLAATILLGANMAQASTVLLAECRGSIVKGNIGETYTIELNTDEDTGASKIVVNSQYINGFSIEIPVSKGTVTEYSEKSFEASAKQKGFREQTLDIDFVSGKGIATSYNPLKSALKSDKIFLAYCTR